MSIHLKQHPEVGSSVVISHRFEARTYLQTQRGTVTQEEILDESYADTTIAVSDSETTILRTYSTAIRTINGNLIHRSYEQKTVRIGIGREAVTVTPTDGIIDPRDIADISTALLQHEAADALATLIPTVLPRTTESWPLRVAGLCSSLNLSCLTSSKGTGRLRSLYSHGSVVNAVIDNFALLRIASVGAIRFDDPARLHLGVTLTVPTSPSTAANVEIDGILFGKGVVPPSAEEVSVTLSFCGQDTRSRESP